MTSLCPICHSIRTHDLIALHMHDSSPPLTPPQPSGLINRKKETNC